MNEITQASYYEHMKQREELAKYLPVDHPKRIKLDDAINEMIKSDE